MFNIKRKFDVAGCAIDYVTPAEEIPDNHGVIAKTFDNQTVIRDFESLKISLMTGITRCTGDILSLRSLYYCLACNPANMRDPAAGTLMSCRYENMTKGKLVKKFDYSINTKLWNGTKKVSCKISCSSKKKGSIETDSPKLQFAGLRPKTLNSDVEQCIQIVRDAISFYHFIHIYPELYWQAVQYILEANVTNTNTLIYWPTTFNLGEPLATMLAHLIYRLTDILLISEIIPRACEIMNASLPGTSDIALYDTKITMSRYNYSLGFDVDRAKLAEYLASIGYSATFFNSNNKFVHVIIPDELENQNNVMRLQKGRENDVRIRANGNVEHLGTGLQSMESTYLSLMLSLVVGMGYYMKAETGA
jgi:hypothetical protein